MKTRLSVAGYSKTSGFLQNRLMVPVAGLCETCAKTCAETCATYDLDLTPSAFVANGTQAIGVEPVRFTGDFERANWID